MTVHSRHTDLRPGKPRMFYGMERTIDGAMNELDDDTPSTTNEPDEIHEDAQSVALIDYSTLRRECLRDSLISERASWNITAFGSVEEWRAADLHPPFAAVVFHTGARKLTGSDAADGLKELVDDFSPIPVIVLADSDEIVQIVEALDCGVRGYIPSSVSKEVCIEAINLVLAGGIFVPASSVFAVRQRITSDTSRNNQLAELFTSRQIKVVDAIRQGKPNKIIAYELNMCESTVKVHIRNIMRKLNATNRTQIAYKIRDMFPREIA